MRLKLTLATHAHLEALAQTTVLALVSVMLINWTLPVRATAVG